ncbi:importin subunit beta-1 [[Candida] jaroonii]|uniref:Importin subunit beta-1 n=1 Tax=[Candida] jaroonii TaxID=467808 RepID=A0ACA9Y840_9ASCO|nr:importin subunit beta-1 [[Candida] jaroonii]
MDIAQILENAILGIDPNVRAQAEAQLNDAATNHFVDYVGYLCGVLADDNAKTEVRMLAGIALKNQLVAKDSTTKSQYHQRWYNLDDTVKLNVKNISIQSLLSSDERVGKSAAQLVAAIAEIELPINQWPELMTLMIDNTKADKEILVKKASLLAIGYICEALNPNDPNIIEQANGILVTIIQGAQPNEETSVRLTALNALVNSLEFIRFNFDKEGERNYIMQVVCEATQADNVDLQEAAFGCLARIMALYYRYMSVYMEKALFNLTVSGIQSPNDRVACMAIEFWSSVCEEEIDLSMQREELGDSLQEEYAQHLISYNFALVSIQSTLPALLQALTRQNDDAEDDDWSVSMAAGACLQLFAQNTGSYVIEPALAFASERISKDSWRDKEAAVMAIGSILDGPELENLKDPLNNALVPIAELISSDHLQVRETVAWCLGKIAEIAISVIDLDTHLPTILMAVSIGLKDHPKVITNCCWTFMNLMEQLCTQGPHEPNTVLSGRIEGIVELLINLSKQDDNEGSSRDAAFEALSVFIQSSAQDSQPIIYDMATDALARLDQTINQGNNLSADMKSNLEDLQTSILALLTTIIRRLGAETQTASDGLMTTFLRLLGTLEPNALIEEDVFIGISAVAIAIGDNFLKYMDAFAPFLVKALTNTDSPTASTAIGIVADLAHSLGNSIQPYLQELMNILGSNISNDQVERSLKPAIFSCFGHLATSLGKSFESYIEFVFQMCRLANSIPDDGTSDTADFLFNIKESVLECYSGIVGGLQENGGILFPYMGEIFHFLEAISIDIDLISIESIASSIVGLLGDIASMFPHQFSQVYSSAWVIEVIKRTRSNVNFSDTTRNTARWAREQQRNQII